MKIQLLNGSVENFPGGLAEVVARHPEVVVPHAPGMGVPVLSKGIRWYAGGISQEDIRPGNVIHRLGVVVEM